MSHAPNTSGPVFGPRPARAELPNPLGKSIRLRIELEGCKGLPPDETSSGSSHSRPFYFVRFISTTRRRGGSVIDSGNVQEGVKSLPGTVQWNEICYLECFELSFIQLEVSSASYAGPHFVVSIPVAQLLEIDKVSLWADPDSWGTTCTLFLSTLQVFDGSEEQEHNTQIRSSARAQNDHFHAGPRAAHSAPIARTAKLLHTILRQLSALVKTLDSSTEIAFHYKIFQIQFLIYILYERNLDSEPSHPRVNALISSMASAIDAILPAVSTHEQQIAEYISDIVIELFRSASISCGLVERGLLGEAQCADMSPEIELPRLIWLILTPDPLSGARNTSANSNRHTISGTIAKDALLFALEAIVQSSDAFPPLKSAASGLLFFATYADMASGNKKQIRDIYKRVDALANALKRGTAKDSPLTPEHHEAINSLAEDIAALNKDLEEIVAERKSRFKRFFSAKRHRAELLDVMTQLETARANYTTAVATVNAMTTARVLAHVQTITLVMGISPMPALEMRRADTVAFPAVLNRFEEV